ncbi:MAG: hypothetical protein J2P32_10360 [Actinobacteria bacterium]|nr:hypothetical protein [Actinomycetota bacterium]
MARFSGKPDVGEPGGGGGRAVLAPRGRAGAKCKLTGAQLRGLAVLLAAAPAAWA